jgi:hypothetical protein
MPEVYDRTGVRQEWCDECEVYLHPKHSCEYMSIAWTGMARLRRLNDHNATEATIVEDDVMRARQSLPEQGKRQLRENGVKGL